MCAPVYKFINGSNLETVEKLVNKYVKEKNYTLKDLKVTISSKDRLVYTAILLGIDEEDQNEKA